MRRDIVLHNPTLLSPPQLSALAALTGGATVTSAAASAKVDRSTVHRWLADDPEFAAALNRSKREAIEAIRAEVQVGAAEAIRVVRGLMADRWSGPSVRLRAALALLAAAGAFDREPIGPTDARDIEAARKKAEFGRLLDNLP